MLIALPASAAMVVSSSPNTQLVKARLALTVEADATSSTYAYVYTLLVTPSPMQNIPYFDNPVTDPVITEP